MDTRAQGLVLRVRPYSDTSLIVHWLTGGEGRLATLARAARRPKSPMRGRLDLFFLCEFTFLRSRHSDLHTLREVQVLDAHPRLREDLGWVQQASYAAALIEQVTETDTPLPEVYQLYHSLLDHLPKQRLQARTVYGFELKLLRELGLEPASITRAEQEVQALAEQLTDLPWAEIGRLDVSRVHAQGLRRYLHGFLIHQFGRLARGRAEAEGGGHPKNPPPDGVPRSSGVD